VYHDPTVRSYPIHAAGPFPIFTGFRT
jgi:hypothetical protein